MRWKVFALALLLLPPCFAGARGTNNTFFVSPTGSDSNNGFSAAAAWQTIAKVNTSTFAPDNFILFQGGQTFAGTITAPTGGTSGHPITIGSYGSGVATISSGAANCITAQNRDGWAVNGLKCLGNGTTSTVSGVLIDNSAASGKLSNGITLNNIEVTGYGANGVQVSGLSGGGYSNVTISNCSVHGNTFGGTVTNANAGVFVVGVFPTGQSNSNITVMGCEIFSNLGLAASDTIGNGIFFGGVNGGLIDHNYVHDNGANAVSTSGPSGILLGYSSGITIQFNEVARQKSGNTIDGDGIDLDIGVSSSIVQYNWVHDSQGAGLFGFNFSSAGAPSWTGNVYRYNVAQNNGAPGNGTVGEMVLGNQAPMGSVQIYGNTLLTSNSIPVFTTIGSSSVGPVIFSNNILDLFLSNATNFINVNPSGGTWTITGNAYIHNTTTQFTYAGTTYTSLAAFRSGTGQETVSAAPVGTTSDANLRIQGVPGGDTHGYNPSLLWGYQFTGTSPVIGAGVNLSTLYGITATKDFYGNPAVDSGGGYTIGAYGYPR